MSDDKRDDQSSEESGERNDMNELQEKIEAAREKDEQETEALSELEIALEAQKEAEERALRALAELKNAQQRMEKEKSQFAAFAMQGVVLAVVDIYENYHRLLEHEPENLDLEWKKGFELVGQQFQQFFEAQGVSVIEVKVGDKIDPEKHEAMMTGEGEEGVILEVFSKGYMMKDRVIKTAKVKVGKKM